MNFFLTGERLNAPLHTAVSEDHFCLLTNPNNYLNVPDNLTPKPMLNDGNFVISLANFCRWLAQQAESAGVEIFPGGFAAADILYDKQGAVAGITTSDMGGWIKTENRKALLNLALSSKPNIQFLPKVPAAI